MDVRRSRRDRLVSIPPDHLLLMAREWMFGGNNFNKSVAHVTRVLESAAARGSDESGWLLDKLRSKGAIPEFGDDGKAKRRGLAKIMATDDTPRAQYYRGRALVRRLGNEDDAGLKLLRQSAKAGFAPAMSRLGLVVEDEDEKLTWLRKAAELNDPDGLYQLALWVGEGRFELLCEAAARGHAGRMWSLAEEFFDRLSPVEAATFGARHVLYTGLKYRVGPSVGEAAQRMENGQADANDVAVLCATGRELEGYDQLWDVDKLPHESHLCCIDVFLTVTHRARRAALQTVAGLRELGLPRDVAVLIGRMVFATRTDAWSWWQH